MNAPATITTEPAKLPKRLRDIARQFARDDPAPDSPAESYVEWEAATYIERLEEALRPFVKMAACTDHTDTRDGEFVMRLQDPASREFVTLSRDDFRNARATLSGGIK